jgi:hypothetical protein
MPKSHCVRGHPFTPENTRVTARQRICRACQREDSAARYAEWYRALGPDGRRRLLLDRGLGPLRTVAAPKTDLRGLRAPQRELEDVQGTSGDVPGG